MRDRLMAIDIVRAQLDKKIKWNELVILTAVSKLWN